MSGLILSGLEGKVAVVTGAGRMRSIGRPIAVELARAGCDIVLTGTGRSPDRYPAAAQAARGLAELGRVDIVVNNAGAARGEDRVPVIDLDPALWRTILDVNLTGSFL